MSFELFRTECPGAAFLLGRFLDDRCLELVCQDYERVAAAGGNDELGVVREDGVSYNKRVARLLTIIAKEVACHDFETLRLSLYACALDPIDSGEKQLNDELALIRTNSRPFTAEKASVVFGALLLDRCRHVHMTSLSLPEQESLVQELIVSSRLLDGAPIPAVLRSKIEHSLAVNVRRLTMEMSSGPEGL
jgi:hypothetical protein